MTYLIIFFASFFATPNQEIATIKIGYNELGQIIMETDNKGIFTNEQIEEMICGKIIKL